MSSWQLKGEIIFADRKEAGQKLAAALVKQGRKFSGVLGLTRGGVPVAFEVASALHIPMDIIVVKKLRSPESPELAIGAVAADGTKVVRQDVLQQLEVTKAYLSREIESRTREAREQEQEYRGTHPPLDLEGASVVIVDDGIATGSSIEAAVLSVRSKRAKTITVAVPVSTGEACRALRKIADDVFCLTTPVLFWAVGMYYQDFSQVPDEEVRRLLDESRATQ